MTVHALPASSGGSLAFVAGGRLLVVAETVDAPFVESAWGAIRHSSGFQALLDLLTSHGLAATPDFALVEWQNGADARLILRGDARVTVTHSTGTEDLTAADVSTWVERTLPGLTSLAITIPSATPLGDALPLEAGVALVASLTMGSASAVAPQAQPVVPEPVTAPATVEPEELIEFDPGVTISVAPEASMPPAAEPAVEKPAGDYDYLFGETMHRSVADAAVREPEPDAEDAGLESGMAEQAPAQLAGDHDGHTVLTSDIAKLRAGRKRSTPEAAPAAAAAPIPVLVIPATGTREALTQPILIGRSPSVSKVSGGQLPRLITIAGNDQDISRNHVQFTLEGGTVIVTDLHSKNGTSILLPGKDPQKLRAGEPTAILTGTVVDLGGGITLTVDEDVTA